MRVIRTGECRVMPWKNGGGTTTEIALHPPGASLDTFEWRLSMAHVGTDGPFSSFPGIDRTLAVLAGAGIALTSDEAGAVTLQRASAPYAFPGEWDVEGRLVDGPIDDLNIMTRRGRWQHRMQRLSGPGQHRLSRGELLVLVARCDGWTAQSEGGSERIDTGDSVLLSGAGDVTLTTGGASAEIFAIHLWTAGGH